MAGRRLKVIVELLKGVVENDYRIGDVGCGGGALLPYLLCSFPNQTLFAIDRSKVTIENSLIFRDSSTKLIKKIIGDGLSPLIAQQETCDVLVLAGMGCQTIERILFHNHNHHHHHPVDVVAAKHVLIQPWPPNLLPMSALCAAMLQLGGFEYSGQACDVVSGKTYVTTLFSRTQGPGKHAALFDGGEEGAPPSQARWTSP